MAPRRRGRPAADSDVAELREQLARIGAGVREMEGDGNCLFRAVADQLYGSQDGHAAVRAAATDYIARHADDFAPFIVVEEDGFDNVREYAEAMSRDKEWGGNTEILAMARVFRVCIAIHRVNAHSWIVAPGDDAALRARCINVSYHDGDHYNSVRTLDDMAGRGPAKPLRTATAAAATLAHTHTRTSIHSREQVDADRDDGGATADDAPEAARGADEERACKPSPCRNGPCVCGSGRVYRRCCMARDVAEAKHAQAAEAIAREAVAAAAHARARAREGRRRRGRVRVCESESADASEDEAAAAMGALMI